MTTISNRPSDADGGLGLGVMFGILAGVIVLVTLFFGYALPALQANQVRQDEAATELSNVASVSGSVYTPVVVP